MKKLLLLSALLIFACSSDSEGNPCIYEPTLETNEVTDITETSATLNGVISIVSENCDVPNNTEQGFVYSTEIQPTLEDTQVNVNGTNMSTTIDGLTPNTTYYVRAFLTNSLGEFYGNEIEFTTNEACDVVYLDDNGVTIKACPNANVGDVGTVNGIEYTIVGNDEVKGSSSQNICTSLVTNMESLYYETTLNFSSTIESWDVSNVINMKNMFRGRSIYLLDLSHWDVSNVTNMSGMFQSTRDTSISSPLLFFNNWDVSNVTDMSYMFYVQDELPINGDVTWLGGSINDWDVSSVINFEGMFMGQRGGNFSIPNISNWDVSSAVNMKDFFRLAGLPDEINLSNWDVSNVTNMSGMFSQTFVQSNLAEWDVSNVTDMSEMFELFGSPTISNPELGISNWNVSNVENMEGMFKTPYEFNPSIDDWDVGNVTNMKHMFMYSQNDSDISNWDVSSVIDMEGMFNSNDTFNVDISNWNVSSVENMTAMFSYNSAFNKDISSWDVSNVIGMRVMFRGNSGFNHPINNWNVDNVINCEEFSINCFYFIQNWSGLPNFTNCNPN